MFVNSSPQTSRHTHTTYLLRNFAANFAGGTSPAKIRQQNLASYLQLTNKYVALTGTYTNIPSGRKPRQRFEGFFKNVVFAIEIGRAHV